MSQFSSPVVEAAFAKVLEQHGDVFRTLAAHDHSSDHAEQLTVPCERQAEGFCYASVDGFCIGGYQPEPGIEPLCHG